MAVAIAQCTLRHGGLSASDQPAGQVLTSELLAQEIVRTVVGTIGLIAAVPISTALAGFAARPPALR